MNRGDITASMPCCFVQPGHRALNQRQGFAVGIELKGYKADLVGDKKMRRCLGWTDLFFIGVLATDKKKRLPP